MLKLSELPAWRKKLRENFTHWEKLADFLELEEKQQEQILKKTNFVLNLPIRLANKIQKKTLDDPILKQFLPTQEENQRASGFCGDPVGDQKSRQAPKLLHKYHGRVLLVCTGACAMHCRYCFRQKFSYSQLGLDFTQELSYISSDPSINEIILSGGDPLSLSNQVLANLLENIKEIPHIKMLRFHTRFPIGIPERIDEQFIEMLATYPLPIWFVLHVNHPREIDDDILAKMKHLQSKGITILTQTVLLKGVNDKSSVLIELAKILVYNKIIPYYLHQLDKIEGASHFEVSEEEGKQIIQEMQASLPGYAVPRYVKEIEGEANKTPIR